MKTFNRSIKADIMCLMPNILDTNASFYCIFTSIEIYSSKDLNVKRICRQTASSNALPRMYGSSACTVAISCYHCLLVSKWDVGLKHVLWVHRGFKCTRLEYFRTHLKGFRRNVALAVRCG